MNEIAIRSDQITEVKLHQFVAEASELGLAPGRWPLRLRMPSGVMVRRRHQLEDGGYQYESDYGVGFLRVYND